VFVCVRLGPPVSVAADNIIPHSGGGGYRGRLGAGQ
jgi:hypothetical protein